ncbi:hypothetical protein ACWDA3_55535 [Nonomuraea rubra]
MPTHNVSADTCLPGCYTTSQRTTERILHLTVHHEDGCPVWTRIQARRAQAN